MIKKHQTKNILDLIEISKSMELNKCTDEKNYEIIYLNVSFDFSNFDGSKKIKV